MKKRLLSLFLAALMILSLLPAAAFAAVRGEDAIPMEAPAPEADGAASPAAPAVVKDEVPATPVADDDLPVVLTAANAETATYDYTGTVTASALSAQVTPTYNNPPSAAVDGQTNTWWHTAWGTTGDSYGPTDLKNDPDKRYIQLDLTETISLDGLRYLSRPMESNNNDYGNGVVTQYRIEVSTDGTTFTPVAVGSWAVGSSAWRVAVFPEAVQAQYVRLYGVRTYGNGEAANNTSQVNQYMSAAELRLLSGVPDDWRPTNLARLDGVTAEASQHEEGTRTNGETYNLNGAQAIDGVKTGDEHLNSGHWSTDQGIDVQRTLTVDLHRNCNIDQIKLFWKNASVYTYTLSTSSDGETWNTVYTQNTRVSIDAAGELVPVSSHNTGVRYVRLQATANRGENNAYWGNVNLWEIEIYGTPGNLITDETPDGNLCRPSDGVTVTATASSTENNNVTANKAIDGGFTISAANSPDVQRWASNTTGDPQWLQIDLGALRTVSIIKVFWQHDSVTAYNVQVSTDATNWTEVFDHPSGRITEMDKVIEITPQTCRYIKINATAYDNQGSATWRNVSIWEVEAYRDADAVPRDASAVLATITGSDLPFTVQNGKLVLDPALDIPEGFTVTFAANLEQVIGADHTVYQPVMDKEVRIDVTVTDDTDPTNTASTPGNSPIRVIMTGAHRATENEGGNAKPAVIPEIMEWYSHGTNAAYKDQSYTLGDTVRIRYRYAFTKVANELKADLEALYPGVKVELARLSDSEYSTLGNVMQDGDIVLYDVNPNSPDTRNRVQGYDDETYGMEIFANKVYIYATHPTGAYWATRTLLQGMKLSEDGKSFPNGTIRDYPEYKVRGFVMDVGRKPMSMDMLKAVAKNMAWYKLNDFHVHLNDNLIWLEDYYNSGENYQNDTAWNRINDQAYAAFRLESNIENLTAKDYSYTKAEFKQFVQDSKTIGVQIVPEIDVPAHAKSIADVFPSIRLRGHVTHSWNDHLDLSPAKYDETLRIVKSIFDEYIDKDGFLGATTVDFGSDEYLDTSLLPQFRKFTKDMIVYMKEKGVTARLWGSMGNDPGDTAQVADGVQMNLWSIGDGSPSANPTTMYNAGYSLLNTNGSVVYIVPQNNGTGGYADYLNLTSVYGWTPNNIGGHWFPASSDQMLGGCLALWQDYIDTRACGLDEVDVFDRFFYALPVIAVRQWGVVNNTPERTLTQLQADIAKLGVAPRTNPYYTPGETDRFTYDFTDATDKSGNGHDLTLTNAEINSSRSLLSLKGGASYAETGLDRLGWGSKLSFRALKLNGGGEEEVLFEADPAYYDYAIKALPVEGDDSVWKLGFSRELYDYEFDVELPVGEWVTLSLTNDQQSTKLSVNGGAAVAAVGKLESKPDSNTQFRGKTGVTNSSFELPVARIGSKTNAFNGYLAAVSTGAVVQSPLTDNKYDISVEKYTVTAGSEETTNHDGVEGPLSNAFDNNVNTYWHSNYNEDLTNQSGKRWIQIELDEPTNVLFLRYQPRPTIANGIVTQYRVEVSTDGTNFTKVAEGDWAKDTTAKLAMFDSAVSAKYIRLYGVETKGSDKDTPNKFMSCAEIRVCRPIDLVNDGPAKVTFSQTSYILVDDKVEPDPIVTLNGAVLTKDTDYTVTYSGNTAPGEATVTVTGKGGYVGTLTAKFEVTAPVVKTDLSTASNASVTFAQTSYPLENGKAEPDPIVKVGDTTLMRGLDYTVTYQNNTATGTATVTVTGVGDYTGTKTATFTVTPAIVKKNLSDAAKTQVTLSQVTFPYEGVAITPEPTVTYEGVTLTKGKDYTVSYARNNAVGTATVTVTGVAPYCEGRASVTFTIVDPAKGNDLSDMNKTVVTLRPTQYEYTGKPITPSYTVRYNGARLTKDVDYTEELLQNVNGGTGVLVIHGKGDYYGSFFATFIINGGGVGSGTTPGNSGSSGGSSSGGGTPSVGETTTEITKGDGVTTVVKTDPFGGVLAQSSYDNGTKVITDIPVTGPVTAIVTVPARLDTVTVTIPTRGEPTPGQVAVILHPDGTEEIVKTSLPTENGVELTLDASATVQVVDNAKAFTDVSADSWAKDAIDFVTSREIFNGTGNSTFTPSGDMSRAMVCTVLANLAGEDTKGGATWYEKAVDWAKTSGVSDGSAPNAIVTREQLAAMLYRYAGSPTVSDEVPRRFRDRDSVSDWAEIAVTWAVQNDLIRGRGSDAGLDLAPQATASRAEVAAVFQRYVALLK